MNVLNIEHIYKTYGDKTIFEDASVGIQEGDKIGIVGINGTGKSTLLKMATGEETPEAGQIVLKNGLKVACLPQEPRFTEGQTLASYVQDGDASEWEVKSLLDRLGLHDMDCPLSDLSGGQRRKAALARVMSVDSDMLILDEPTNHLDQEMTEWLESALRAYAGTVLMVTHDRYFLDNVSNRILEISHGKIYSYRANYSGFLELKAEREEMEQAGERKRRSLLRMELEWAKRGCRARSTKQKARLERLETLKNGKAPTAEQTVSMDRVGARMGRKTIELDHVSKTYGGRPVIDDFSYIFLKDQKVGIIGPNGCGKSTLLKLIGQIVLPDSGSVIHGETVKIGYFAQEGPEMDDGERVIDHVKAIGEYITTSEGRISASQMLERFLFTPDMQYAPIGKLSGGEKRRLYLLTVLCRPINVLLLDEPGNNLDIPTLTILEDYLNSFSGIVVVVSHDRYLLDNVADRILAFEGDGVIRQYEGGYTDHMEAKRKQSDEKAGTDKDPTGKPRPSAKDWRKDRPVKLKFTYKEKQEYETIDEEILCLEEKIGKLEKEMAAHATEPGKLMELTREKDAAASELEEKMDRWVYLNELAEKIEKQKNMPSGMV